jgi:hypothetical protein
MRKTDEKAERVNVTMLPSIKRKAIRLSRKKYGKPNVSRYISELIKKQKNNLKKQKWQI